MVVCHVGQLYTHLRRWQFSTIVWENTNGVHFRAVWKNTAHVQGIIIPWTSAVFSNTVLKWTPFAYHIDHLHTLHLRPAWFHAVMSATVDRKINVASVIILMRNNTFENITFFIIPSTFLTSQHELIITKIHNDRLRVILICLTNILSYISGKQCE